MSNRIKILFAPISFIVVAIGISSFLSRKEVVVKKQIVTSQDSTVNSVKKLLQRHGFEVLDSILLKDESFLFEQIKEKAQIDLIDGITHKYLFKISEKEVGVFCSVLVYDYSSCEEAKRNKAKIDSLSKLTPKQIDPMLYDFMHKTKDTYYNISSSIICIGDANGNSSCLKVEKTFEENK